MSQMRREKKAALETYRDKGFYVLVRENFLAVVKEWFGYSDDIPF